MGKGERGGQTSKTEMLGDGGGKGKCDCCVGWMVHFVCSFYLSGRGG